MVRDLGDLSSKFMLNQIINKPTHKDGNTLDLVFTNNKKLIHNYQIFDTLLSTTHHKIIEISTTYKSLAAKMQKNEKIFHTTFDRLNFFSEDIDWIPIKRELVYTNWQREFKGLDPTLMLKKFIHICESICVKYVPERKTKYSKKQMVPKDRRILIRRRRKINNQLNSNISLPRHQKLSRELVEIEKKLQSSYKQSTDRQEKKAIDAIKRNSKYFFSYAKKFSKIQSDVGPLIDSQNQYIYKNKDVANALSQQYSSVFSKPLNLPVDPQVLFKEDTNPIKPVLNDLQ